VELESFFASDGNATHQARYHLENDGATTFDVPLPGGADLKWVEIDGQPVDQLVAQSSTGNASIRLPAQSRLLT
jgi:hypothetical protein